MIDNNNFSHENNHGYLPRLLIKTYFSTWALMRIGQIHSMNIIGVVLFLVLIYFFGKNYSLLTPKLKSDRLLTGGFSAIFSFFYLAGCFKTITSDVNNGLFRTILLLATFLGLFFLCGEILSLLSFFVYDGKKKLCPALPRLRPKGLSVFLDNLENNRRKLPLLCFVLCILSRLVFFLYSYPGIMTPDSINQLEQVLGMKPFSNHHPWIHTMIISFFYHLGRVFTDNRNLALAFYTIFQIIFMATAASYLIFVLLKYVKSTGLLFFLVLLYAFLPYHNVMAICIWKDVMFSGSVLIFCTALLDLLMIQRKSRQDKQRISLKQHGNTIAIYFISGLLFCLLRTNGWYAFLITLPFLFLCFWQNRRSLYPIQLILFLLVVIIKGPVMEYYQVTQPDFVESLSIPLQQVGRVVATGNTLTVYEEELLSKIMDIEHIPRLYTEYISDPMKELVRAGNPDYLTAHKAEYFKLWLFLGLRYPHIYLDAYIEQTKGFYSPSTVYSVAEVDGVIDSDTGITREYLIGGKIIVKIREILLKLHEILPLYGTLWSMGSLLWMILTLLYLKLMGICRESGQEFTNFTGDSLSFSLLETITLWLPSLAIIATLLLATPVAIEFRYAYHLAYCFPFYLGIINFQEKNSH